MSNTQFNIVCLRWTIKISLLNFNKYKNKLTRKLKHKQSTIDRFDLTAYGKHVHYCSLLFWFSCWVFLFLARCTQILCIILKSWYHWRETPSRAAACNFGYYSFSSSFLVIFCSVLRKCYMKFEDWLKALETNVFLCAVFEISNSLKRVKKCIRMEGFWIYL